MRVIVVAGSRDSTVEQRKWLLAELAAAEPALVLVGDNRDTQKDGRHRRATDQAARQWCSANGVQCNMGLAWWDTLIRRAGPLRNESLAHIAAALKAFGDDVTLLACPGEGTGTPGAVKLFRKGGITGLSCDAAGAVTEVVSWRT